MDGSLETRSGQEDAAPWMAQLQLRASECRSMRSVTGRRKVSGQDLGLESNRRPVSLCVREKRACLFAEFLSSAIPVGSRRCCMFVSEGPFSVFQ